MIIKKITAKKILASLGDETIEAAIEFESGKIVSASVPAGISAGKYEIKKVPAGVAVEQIEQINLFCSGKVWTQESLDAEISSHDFGGNSTLAVSAAFYKMDSIGRFAPSGMTIKFPKLMLLLFEGGEHGNKNITMQEFMIVEDSLVQTIKDSRTMREYLEDNLIERTVGAEGGFSPLNFTNQDAIDTIKKVLPDKKISIDMAECFGESQIPENVFSVEDPFNDESWEDFAKLTVQNKYLVIGDDLTTTNPVRIKKAIDLKAINGVVIKPNQIGTITQAKEAVRIAKEAGLKIIVSHRGEETDDAWIVDFALDVQSDYVKFGGMDRGERVAKYNRLMELGMT